MTLNNNRQKINDCLGNPVEIGIAVTWRIVDTAKAVFNVDNYKEFLSLQCDSALRNIVRLYPYDVAPNVDTTGDGIADDGSLRGSSEVVAGRIRDEIQRRVNEAGIEIIEARITYLAYATEIAAAMLQRQQASAVVDARKLIVDGAVGMVEMALARLSENQVVTLDEERKAAMVSNLLVVLCGNHDAQPSSIPEACIKQEGFLMNEKQKKQVPLRLSPKLYNAIAAWAEDDFRSVNGQIEYLLTECVRQRKKNGKYVSEELDIPRNWISNSRGKKMWRADTNRLVPARHVFVHFRRLFIDRHDSPVPTFRYQTGSRLSPVSRSPKESPRRTPYRPAQSHLEIRLPAFEVHPPAFHRPYRRSDACRRFLRASHHLNRSRQSPASPPRSALLL